MEYIYFSLKVLLKLSKRRLLAIKRVNFSIVYSWNKESKKICASVPRDLPIIRLVELDGFQAAVGVYCDPMSPTRDEVHGVKFIESDVTEEVSDGSDGNLVWKYWISIFYKDNVFHFLQLFSSHPWRRTGDILQQPKMNKFPSLNRIRSLPNRHAKISWVTNLWKLIFHANIFYIIFNNIKQNSWNIVNCRNTHFQAPDARFIIPRSLFSNEVIVTKIWKIKFEVLFCTFAGLWRWTFHYGWKEHPSQWIPQPQPVHQGDWKCFRMWSFTVDRRRFRRIAIW